MLHGPFPPWPNFSQEEADKVSRVLLSNKVNYWTGDECKQFEKEFATFAGAEHAIAVTNGTIALDLALVGLGIGSHNGGSSTDEVIVTPRSFLASVSCVVNAGAIPIFADVDLETQLITAQTVAPHITANTKAIICVHLFGWPCDMDALHDLVEGRGIKLIEDCAQAHGAKYKGKPVGSLGDVAAWSFCQDKIMTTGGEGGMVTCNDMDLWKKMWAYKDHGKSYDAVFNREHPPGFRWLHESFGTNWRMTEIQAAIGRIQLKRLPDWTRQRRENAKALKKLLMPFSGPDKWLRIPDLQCVACDGTCNSNEACEHAWYKFSAFVQPENLPTKISRDDVINMIAEQGLPCMQGSCSEIYLERAFDNTTLRPVNRLPNAQKLGETSLLFVVHPGVDVSGIALDLN